MQDLKEKGQDKDIEMTMQTLKEKYEEAQKELAAYQLREVVSNQPVFNQWIKESIEVIYAMQAKLEGKIDQIGQGLTIALRKDNTDDDEDDEDFDDNRKKRY